MAGFIKFDDAGDGFYSVFTSGLNGWSLQSSETWERHYTYKGFEVTLLRLFW